MKVSTLASGLATVLVFGVVMTPTMSDEALDAKEKQLAVAEAIATWASLAACSQLYVTASDMQKSW